MDQFIRIQSRKHFFKKGEMYVKFTFPLRVYLFLGQFLIFSVSEILLILTVSEALESEQLVSWSGGIWFKNCSRHLNCAHKQCCYGQPLPVGTDLVSTQLLFSTATWITGACSNWHTHRLCSNMSPQNQDWMGLWL